MRKVLLLGLMLWGSASAQTAASWTAAPNGAQTRFRFTAPNTEFDYAGPGVAAIEGTLLELSFTTVVGAFAKSVVCTKWIYVGMENGSVVAQTFTGGSDTSASIADLQAILDARDQAKALALAPTLCEKGKLTLQRTLYLPLNTPLAITQNLTISLKTDATGHVVTTLLK